MQNDSFWFNTAANTESINRLLYTSSNGGRLLLVAGVGQSGKTALLHQLHHRLIDCGQSVRSISAAALDSASLVRQLAASLSIRNSDGASVGVILPAIAEELIGRAMCSGRMTLIIDDMDRAAESLDGVIQALKAIGCHQASPLCLVIGTQSLSTCPWLEEADMAVRLVPFTVAESRHFLARHLGTDETAIHHSADASVMEITGGQPGRLLRLAELLKVARQADAGILLNGRLIDDLTRQVAPHLNTHRRAA